ncbi:hypothetical protein ONZ45_g2171 [Pleurotus djamor]|nr:hypothetical protein ONZ45_g2171 [Pleurotus djamor]
MLPAQLQEGSSETKQLTVNDDFVVVEKPKSARVVLPSSEDAEAVDTDEEVQEDEDHGPGDDEDFLVDFPDDTPELELVHLKIASLANLRLPRFGPYIKKLCLRQNIISSLDPEIMASLTELEELDLYDNKIKTVGDSLQKMGKIRVLDFSFNLLKAVPEGLASLTSLQTLYFVQNKINKIKNLESLVNLTSLELGGNRLREIENLDALSNLEELWLGKNKISKLKNLDHLKKLRILALQSNRVTKLENLDGLESLEELYLSHNGIQRLEGLEKNTRLRTLDIGVNFIEKIENISHLSNLEEFWANGNKIPDLHALETQLGHIKSLETLYLEANPCQMNDMAGYRRKIMLALPQLKQIDATYVRAS